MIKVDRNRNTKGIPAAFRGTKRLAKNRLLLDKLHGGSKPEDLVYDSGVWKGSKTALKNETAGKCAYCEAPAGGRTRTGSKGGLVAHCDVEHFRPKDLYWWLAHCFENYLYSCQICNQSFKGNKFPTINPRLASPVTVSGLESEQDLQLLAAQLAPDPLETTSLESWVTTLLTEDADFIDPLREDPEQLFKYRADDILREVSIVPLASSGRPRKRASSTIEELGLDREELRFARHDVYSTISVFRDVLGDPGLSPETKRKVEDQLSKLMCSDQPFAGMNRYFILREWKMGIQPAARDSATL